ncbi:uncharacterized protein LOC123558952 [Mercenaria mercenaria]|uniref:uncharacterized protein LOC123558952 n=1 Tax=Mercenaria mercenaria TaxID=6596 RepID=UPI00234F4CF9|nr:uncharacterized protein LOC123558952 [Mercenaria mercenaria]
MLRNVAVTQLGKTGGKVKCIGKHLEYVYFSIFYDSGKMVKSFEDSSWWFKSGLVFNMLALILGAVGFFLPNFLEETVSEHERLNSGLWQTCTNNKWNGLECQDSIFIDTDWFLGVKVLQCIGLAATALTTLISLALLLAVTNQRLAKANVTVCFAALSAVGTSTILSIKMLLVTPENSDYTSRYLGISFYLCVFATCSLLTAWIVFIVDQWKTN